MIIRTTISPGQNKINKNLQKENEPILKTEIEFLSEDSDDLITYMKKGKAEHERAKSRRVIDKTEANELLKKSSIFAKKVT